MLAANGHRNRQQRGAAKLQGGHHRRANAIAGDLLVQANLVTEQDIAAALGGYQSGSGGRLGDNLVGVGAISQQTLLEQLLKRIPTEPADIEATGIDEVDLLSLLMKLIYTE